MQIKDAVKRILTRRLDRRYDKDLAKRKVSYDAWVRKWEQDQLSDTMEAEENYVLFLQSQGSLHPHARKWIGEYFSSHKECLILYGDEDIMDEDGIRRSPWYKPCWSPDLYLDFFYPGSVIAVRKDFFKDCYPQDMEECSFFFFHPHKLRKQMDRLFLEAGGFERSCTSIAAISKILFHAKEEAVWEEYFDSSSDEIHMSAEEETFISVIIPSKDNPSILKRCLETLKSSLADQKSEIIVVDNGSNPQNRREVEGLTQGMIYLYQPMEFNFSAMCNMGAKRAQGNLLLFLNDDVELQGTKWLEQMRAKALLPYVGAVGLKLYYPDTVKIQHVGVTNLFVGPSHKLQFLEDNKSYYFGRNRFDHDCLAVTAACLMLETKKFWEVGGFWEELKVAYNDVDLGFCLWEAGYQNVVLNNCFGIHHESLSRGSDETREKQQRLERERMMLYRRHPALKGRDPYYPELLNSEIQDNYIRPLYITADNSMQQPCWRKLPRRLADCKEDACIMVRIEITEAMKIRGYGLVLWDDNACYKKYLILQPEEKPEKLLYMKLKGQHRGDLEQNIPDQKNVGLSGFCISRSGECLEPGTYRIGLLAVRCIGRLKLLGWSGKYLQVKRAEEGEQS